jgi:16S rRNA processing protein RimM
MELTQIGYFSKTHGTKGELALKYSVDFFVDEVKAIFIDTATGKAPYFVKEFKQANTGLIVGLEDIDSIEKAKSFVGKSVFINSEFIDTDTETLDWIGFEVIDHLHGNLGKIIEVNDNGTQLLVTINYKTKEIILPLVEDLIEKIDEENKQIFYKSPEGLIDIYIS